MSQTYKRYNNYLKPFKFKNNKGLFLAYDHGMEHGPKDFDALSHDPSYIISIAKKGKVNGIIFQKGIAEKYIDYIPSSLPLIVKLNGKTLLSPERYFSSRTSSVEFAYDLGARAVGYTIYFGSPHEQRMIEEFSHIHEESRSKDMAVILWAYARGPKIINDTKKDIVSYSARVGMELGADILKVKYTGSAESFKEVLSSIHKTLVFCAGGSLKEEDKFFDDVNGMVEAGVNGLAVGRNIWRSPEPLHVINKIKDILGI